ncbi:TlpA disulfide reductase family protein [Massilia sp. MS-15]|uniref:TlpA family protein disulfide reductase n=1 Tax=Massilia sp. MS-15 TaxID=2878200 RepID=UPI001CD2CE14|nr:TlpA disulfide reductase family protein [Massilia sp. MS-15]MCA1247177.1 TlpA family protein disulfide reductase [Massilia sp. MS-15]
MNKKHVAIYAAVAAMFGIMGALVALNQKELPPMTGNAGAAAGAKPPVAVDKLFAQSLNDLQGKPEALARWRGKPLVVNFWATWCAPCVQEMPELSELAGSDGGKTFNVIGIGIDSPSNMQAFAAKLKIAYPLYVGGMGGTELSRAFGNSAGGLPYTVLIGADGQVRKTYLGKLKFDELRADLAKL